MRSSDNRPFFNPERGAIEIPMAAIKGLPRTVHHEGEVFYRVADLAVTVCSITQIEGLQQPSKHRSNVLRAISRQLAFNTVIFGGFANNLSLCHKEDSTAKSIITGADVLGLREWVRGVREDAAIALPIPYPYVTLYTRGDVRGVPLQRFADVQERCTAIRMPEIETVLRQSA